MLSISVTLRRIRFWWRLSGAYLKRYSLRITIAFFLIFIIFVSFYKIWPLISRSNVISIGYVGAYTIENIPTEILSLVTRSLISVDKQGHPIGALASHWTISDDGKTYIVFLKDNLTWHDSTQVDANNISLAISDVQITALNNKALEFKLKNPIASFPQALDKPIFKAETFYGTGEYVIVKIDQVEDIIKKIVLHPKNSKLPRVEIKFYQNQQETSYALSVGEIKFANISSVSEFQNWPNLNVEKKIDNSQIITIFFNTEDALLASKDLRQALIYAINRVHFDGEDAYSPISPLSWAYNERLKQYNYNTGKAKELLAKIEGQKIKINLSTITGLKDIAEQIKADWQSIGIEVEIIENPATPTDFQAFLAINKIMPDPDQYALWHSTQNETNITKYKNVKADKLLEDARITSDESKRKELYLEFQEEIIEDAPAAFLYHPYKYKVIYKNIEHLYNKLTI